jgi:hypothetical protein
MLLASRSGMTLDKDHYLTGLLGSKSRELRA